MVLEIVSLTVGTVGILFGTLCGWRLRQWERQLGGARIAVAYKGRVKMQAPLMDWLTWANTLAKDERSTGRVVVKFGGVTVAILKPKTISAKTETRVVKTKAAA